MKTKIPRRFDLEFKQQTVELASPASNSVDLSLLWFMLPCFYLRLFLHIKIFRKA